MIRELLAQEIIKRHGCGAMTGKLRPVHIANGLFRETLGSQGKTRELKQLFIFTAPSATDEEREKALTTILETSREKWGRLADTAMEKDSVLAKRVLPMLRSILGTDGAAFGQSPEHSSLSTPTGGMVTGDPSDEHAGAFIYNLWSSNTEVQEKLVALVREIIDPEKDLAGADDLTVVLSPLCEGIRKRPPDQAPVNCEDLSSFIDGTRADLVLEGLIKAAHNLAIFELSFRPSAISTLERIVCLGSLSVFYYMATRHHTRSNAARRPLLIQAYGSPESVCAKASRDSVEALMRDSYHYLEDMVSELLDSAGITVDDEHVLDELEKVLLQKATGERSKKDSHDLMRHLRENFDQENGSLVNEITTWVSKRDTISEYLRRLGLRTGLLYPQQRNPRKRVVLSDRVTETLVAGAVNLKDEIVDYQEFLERLWSTFGLITGGRTEDETLLASSIGRSVRSHYLRQNSEAFLRRLEQQGLARRLADSKALVGLLNFKEQ